MGCGLSRRSVDSRGQWPNCTLTMHKPTVTYKLFSMALFFTIFAQKPDQHIVTFHQPIKAFLTRNQTYHMGLESNGLGGFIGHDSLSAVMDKHACARVILQPEVAPSFSHATAIGKAPSGGGTVAAET